MIFRASVNRYHNEVQLVSIFIESLKQTKMLLIFTEIIAVC